MRFEPVQAELEGPPLFAGEILGAFAADARWAAISPELRHEAKRSLLNFCGGALGVARTEPVNMAMAVLTPLSGPPQATVIGRAERLDILSASYANALAANLLDYDDTHLNTVIHPTAPVAPGALALAELRGCSGPEVLLALILGAEVECRIGNAVSPNHYARGWHITSTCGVFGAAIAGARLLRLKPSQTWHALGIAASQSAGLVENLPSAAKNAGMGNAARNGVFSALLAEQGYTAAPAAIEGPFGWARAMGDSFRMAGITEDLGVRWEFLKNTYKPYPCGIVFHAVIDACLELRADHALTPEDIANVTVRGNALLLDRGSRPVTDDRDAKISIRHCAAAAFVFGSAGLREFSAEVVMRPTLVAFRQRVRIALDEELPTGAAAVTVETKDGRGLTATVLNARGSLERPLSDQNIEDKVRDLARHGDWPGDVDRMMDMIWNLEDTTELGPLMRLLSLSKR
jgi:2-methylcitrate dehydratase PrpD